MKSNNAQPEKYCCDSQPETGACQSVQINPSCPALHWHPSTCTWSTGQQGRGTCPWLSSGMEKGTRREETWSRGWEHPGKAISGAVVGSAWCSIFPCAGRIMNKEQTARILLRGILLHGRMDELGIGKGHLGYRDIQLSQGISKHIHGFVRVIFPLSEDRGKRQQNF